MRHFFARLDEKQKLFGNFEKILKFFDEISIEKLNFFCIFIFFRKFVTKNRAFGNNTIFIQQFFRFRGVGNFPPFRPWLRPFCELFFSFQFWKHFFTFFCFLSGRGAWFSNQKLPNFYEKLVSNFLNHFSNFY